MSGIKNWLRDNVWSPIVRGVKSLFGINSPSTVFADFGFQMIRGLVKGLVKGNAGGFVKKVFGGVTDQANRALNWLVDKGHITLDEITKATGQFQGSGILGGLGGNTSASGGAQSYAKALLSAFGWSSSQWPALKTLWHNESGWNPLAHNPSSGAHGIPQSLPASKMASEGADYWTNPATQIRWGMKYIRDRYGSPMAALNFWNSKNPHWYGAGLDGGIFRQPTLIGVGERGPERVDVVPLGQRRGRQGGGDIHVHIHGPVGSERELERWLVQALRKANRTVGSI
ncbi:MAG: transglycosylase SLT domain-containing protein [Actinobacteria bacterium]|nr:transglycosylase SLT domain-containing protein [Actinomycetota bacterium]